MRAFRSAVLLAALVCVPAPALRAQDALPKLPERVGDHVLAVRDALEPPGRGLVHRYERDGGDRIDVFVYRVPDDADGPQAAVDAETEAFLEVLPLGPARGWYDAYRVAYDQPAPQGTVPGRTVAVAERIGDDLLLSLFYVHVVGDAVIKVRSTMPADALGETRVPRFVEKLVRGLARGTAAEPEPAKPAPPSGLPTARRS